MCAPVSESTIFRRDPVAVAVPSAVQVVQVYQPVVVRQRKNGACGYYALHNAWLLAQLPCPTKVCEFGRVWVVVQLSIILIS